MYKIDKWSHHTLIIIVVSLSVLCDSSDRTICNMISDGGGQCVVIRECDVALKVLRSVNFDPASDAFKNSLRTISCGFQGREPKVCCPYNNKLDVPFGCSTSLHKSSVETQLLTSTSPPDIGTMENNETCLIFEATAKNIEKKTSAQKPFSSISNDTQELQVNFTKKNKAMVSKNIIDLPEDKLRLLPNLNTCGNTKNAVDRIVGGSMADIDEFPWLAGIVYNKSGKLLLGCGGTLINSRYVLTACHCVTVSFPIHAVRLGEYDTETDIDCQNDHCNLGIVDYSVSTITRIEEDPGRRFPNHDIALLRLRNTVTFTDFIKPICLPIPPEVARQDLSPDNTYIAAGWGKTEFSPGSPIIRKVSFKYTDVEICRLNFKDIIAASDKDLYICAGGRKGEDTCAGDSGGPLQKFFSRNHTTNAYLLGITSYGTARCGTEGVPGIYTRIVPYLYWILNNLQP